MFEFEVNHSKYLKSDLPTDVKDAFTNNRPKFAAVSILQWEEHCTECAMPQCYSTCDLYESRKDGKCRRFVEGISAVKDSQNNLSFVKIIFKQWGALMATGYLNMVSSNKVDKLENKSNQIASLAVSIPDSRLSILGRRGISSRLATRYKKKLLHKFINIEKISIKPDYFFIEIFNPNDFKLDLTFIIRAISGDKNQTPFQQRLNLDYGFHQIKISYSTIKDFIDIDKEHFVSFVPNFENTSELTVSAYFGFLGFVKDDEISLQESQLKQIKIVAWDLDNTVWKGILVEDGAEQLQLMPKIKHIMQELDKRGIVNSVISKNNYDDAFKQLQKFDLDKFIVFPQISWSPKSDAIKAMSSEFNVNVDTIAFVDDSAFEREEVKSTNPEVRVYDAIDYLSLLKLPEFNPVLSTESSKRREFYQNQSKRKAVESSFSGGYLDFILSCNIELYIDKATIDSADRIQELVQRTNQMNFSGNRYQREEIDVLLKRPDLDNYCIRCKDKFGDYGTVGFCVVDNNQPTLIDLMFSCRIQSKRIEHAFITWVLYHYRDSGSSSFNVEYNKTPKNSPAGKVFVDLGFNQVNVDGNRIYYKYNLSDTIKSDGLMSIQFEGELWEP